MYIFKDTMTLCKLLMQYSKNVSKLIRFTEYSVAISKACAAMDLVRRINSSFEGREEKLKEFILLISEVKSRITLFADAGFIPVKTATNIDFVICKVSKEGYGWLKKERGRKGES